MTVEQWINGIKNINSYLPLMQQYTRAFSEEDLITEVITANIPSTWNKDYRLANLHLKMQIKHIIGALTIIEEHVKIQPSANSNANKKNSRIPAEYIMEATSGMTAIKTLKMQRAMGKITRQAMVKAKMRTMVILENKDAPKAVAFNLEHLLMATAVAKQEAHPIVKSYKYNCINEKKSERENTEQTPSSEILVNLPNTKNSKKYTTYIGLVDSGSSGSLLNSSIIENDFSVEKQKNPTKWDTATGVLLTKGKVFIEALSLPQFTRQRKVSTTFYLFEKRKDDKYDIIIGRDFLQAIGLDKYQVLPQGMKPATDIFQQCMNTLYHDMSNVDTFLDDSMLLGYRTFSVHLEMVIEVLSKWFQHCVTYLGFIITREGIKPQPDKIQGILNMKCPTSQKEVRCFVGMANF